MPRSLISRKTLTEFRDRMTGWVLREIDGVFAAAGIRRAARADVDAKGGARRVQVELYYASLDLTRAADVKKLLKVFESVLASTRRDFTSALHSLKSDGYVYRDGRIRAASVADPAIHDELRRIEESIERDPALAIASSKELIERVCKTILEVKGVTLSKTADLSRLLEATAKALKIAGDIAALQALYGTGHGKSAKTKELQPRYARLVVGATSALVNFLWDASRAG